MGAGHREDVRFTANRHNHPPPCHPFVTAPLLLSPLVDGASPERNLACLTGKVLEGGEAWFVFVDRWGNETRWNLGAPESLPNLYAP